HPKTHESKNCQKEQCGDSAWQIALSCKDKREQAEEDNNASDRLAKKRDDQQDAAYPGDRDSEYLSDQPSSPQPYRDQCRSCHPDAKLISIFQQADRPEAGVALSAYPAIGLIAVQVSVDLRPGKDLDQANWNVSHARDD